jgi:hypothetical protein
MNTATFADLQQLPDLIVIIDFKWLMAGVGVRVHVERLQGDRDYAAVCLGQGAMSHIPALRDCARHLANLLHITLPLH